MIITREIDYAFRIVLHLSRNTDQGRIEAKFISEEEAIPLRFALKILRKLVHSGLVQSFKGIHGGYILAVDPENVSLLDVIEAVDGDIFINRCMDEPSKCNAGRGSSCNVHHALKGAQVYLNDYFKMKNFKDLL